MEAKAFWKSKTLWTNVIAIVLYILSIPELGASVPSELLPVLAMLTSALNVLLRLGGGAPIGTRDSK